MKVRMLVIAGMVAWGLASSAGQAQVMQLGRMPAKGQVEQASCECSGGGGGWFGKMGVAGHCDTCSAPSCGMAGDILGDCDDSCCGYGGLGYSGGFGLCGGGDCGSCGVGGYFGRNVHRVNPCACGGSLLGDLVRGALTVVDRTVGCVVGGVFGGLRSVTCHASGSFAALECAAQASCHSCGGGGCDDCCLEPTYTGGSYETMPMQPTPAAAPADVSDPFTDDPPSPSPQASRVHPSRVQRATYVAPKSRIGAAVQKSFETLGSRANSLRNRTARGRGVTLRR